jgi:drug/metabolite transporter (DMT)-like permease
MDKLVPWPELCAVIEPLFRKAGTGLTSVGLERILRMHFIVNWFKLVGDAYADAMHDTRFRGELYHTHLKHDHLLDTTTLAHFRHFLKQYEFGSALFARIDGLLLAKGMKLSGGSVADAIIIPAAGMFNDSENARIAEMRESKDGNQVSLSTAISTGSAIPTLSDVSVSAAGTITRLQSRMLHEVIKRARLFVLTLLAMVAFACNSLLCRYALNHTSIDAASFTTIRLISGALILMLVVRWRHGTHSGEGSWLSALALFACAAGFSYSYVSLNAATGSLLFSSAAQITMIIYSHWVGDRFLKSQLVGLVLAFCGLIELLLPGLSAPPLFGCLVMLGTGIAWGFYCLRGKNAGDPIQVTAGNFLRAVPIAAVLSLSSLSGVSLDVSGIGYAFLSGALTTGIGFTIWYIALPDLKTTHAATVQLCVPVIAALGGILFLGEHLTLGFVSASAAILGGIVLVILEKRQVRI